MKIIISIILMSICITFFGQKPIDCDKVLNQEPHFVKMISDTSLMDKELVLKDFEILNQCGNFDSLDWKIFFTGPILASYLVKYAVNTSASYKTLIEFMESLKKAEGYIKYKEATLAFEKIENKKVNIKNWKTDSIVFVNIGFPDAELKNLEIFIFLPENRNMTYKQVCEKYAEKKNSQLTETTNRLSEYKSLIDYDMAIKEAKDQNKKLLIFFTGFGCVNADKMKEKVLFNNGVKEKISKDFVCYLAYVDDKTKLSKQQQYVSKFSGKTILTIGEKNYDLQIGKFGINSQPYIVVIDGNGKILSKTGYTYDLDVNRFMEFLDSYSK